VPAPLTALRVLEIGGPPGAFAGMMLADHGADVLKIARPGAGASTGAGMGASVMPLGRGRRSLRVDLRHRAGAETFLRLADLADALVEGYRPGVMERLGLGPATCLARNPRLVYGRMTGWGQTGPWAERAGHDLNYVALSGVLNQIGERDGPPVMPINLVGDWAGGLLMAFGIVTALHQVARSGVGLVVDSAMLDTAALLGAIPHAMAATGTWDERRAANMTDGGWPFYRIYRTADDRFVSVAALEPQFYAVLLERLGLADAGVPGLDEVDRWDEIADALGAAFATRTREEWCRITEGTDACVAPVLSLTEAQAHPHNVVRGVFVDHEGVRQPSPAPRFGGEPSTIRPWADCDVPLQQILTDWGLAADAAAELVSLGALTA
jgi:alpha-methylacyl-CoA racemase